MAEISSASGEVFKTEGTKLISPGGKTYKITGFDPDSIATQEYVDEKISSISSA